MLGFDEATSGETTVCLYRKGLMDATILDASKRHNKDDSHRTGFVRGGEWPLGKLMVRYRGIKPVVCVAYNPKRAASMLCPVV